MPGHTPSRPDGDRDQRRPSHVGARSGAAATLRRVRDTRLVTQRALADLAGASQAAVARVERGDRMPSIPLVERLLAALDLQLSVAVEPLDAHLDARMAELAARSLADQIDALGATRPGSAPG